MDGPRAQSDPQPSPARLLRAFEDSRLESDSAMVFVWGVWALLFAIAYAFVNQYGAHTPRWEDWFHVPFVTGERAITARWLWEPVCEHRLPLLKLLMVWDFRLFNLSPRPVLFLNVSLFGLLAGLLIYAVRRVRGRLIYADALFPMVLLNVGQGEAFLWAGTIAYVLTVFLLGIVLVTLMVTGSRLSVLSATGIGVCLILMILTMGGGLVYAVCLSGWMAWIGLTQIRSGEPRDRRGGISALITAGITCLLGAFYFVGYTLPKFDGSDKSIPVTPDRIFETAVKYLAMGLGAAAKPPVWPASGWISLGMLTFGMVCMVWVIRHRGPGRRRGLGVAWVMCCCWAVAIVTGKGRVASGEEYLFNSRYVSTAVPVVLVLYCLCEVGTPLVIRSLGRMTLFTIVAAFTAMNMRLGYAEAKSLHDQAALFERDVRAGVAIPELISRHAPITYYYHELLADYLHQLRDARIGDYRHLPADPVYQTISISPSPASVEQVDWQGLTGHATGTVPALIFKLDRPIFVCGIRLRYATRNLQGLNPFFQLDWRNASTEAFASPRTYKHLALPSDGTEVDIPVWIFGMLDEIRIRPDKRPCEFKILSIEVLVR